MKQIIRDDTCIHILNIKLLILSQKYIYVYVFRKKKSFKQTRSIEFIVLSRKH